MTSLFWVVARQLRPRWRSWALLATLVGLTGAVVLTATAGARRTDSAYPRFLQSAHAADVLVSPNNTGFGGYYQALAKLPGAETVAPVIGIQALPFRPGPKLVEAQVYAPADRRYGNVIERPRVVSGRLPDPSRVHEVALDLRATQQLHVQVGGTIMLAATLSAGPPGQQPKGLKVFRQRVVGVFVTRDNPVPINALAQLPVVYATHAFYAALGSPYRGFDGAYVRLRPGASAFQFGRQAEALAQRYPATGGSVFVANLSDQAAQIERAIRPEAIALGLFALVVALAALVIIAQAVLRQLRASRIDLSTLRALGLTRMQLWSISLLQVTAVAIVGGLVAVAASVLASPIMPLGAARLAEPSPGIDVDVAVLGLGFVAVVVLLVAAVAWPSWRLNSETQTTRYSRTAPLRSGRRLAWLTSSAAPVTASLGIREALNPGAARGAVPVRSALVGTILSIVVVIGTLTFGASLVHLVTTPQLYGQTWQASIDTQFQTIPSSFIHASLNHRRGVVGWIAGNFGTVDVMNSHIPAIGLARGVGPLVGPTLVSGHLPTRPDEIALGASVLRSVDREVGQDLTVHVNGVRRKMHIVGQAVFPAFDQGSFTATDLGLGAVVTAGDLVPPGVPVSDSYVFFLVRFAPGPDQASEVASFGRATARYCSGVQQTTCFVTKQVPFDVGNYARIEDVPEFLALVLAVLGVGVLTQLMILWVQRRRREIAILKTIGFVRRQVVSLIAWQASTFAVLSLVVGIPLGIIVGRGTWALFANELGIGASSVVPSTRIVLCVPAVLLISLLVAVGPAWFASRLQPARVFRTE
ncbi:MAG TPA: FtsX-like permease family protein [Acidimicrobiales bacterium]|nr:FtsX-like permease family protein [Acidimicrobiales bacterium]